MPPKRKVRRAVSAATPRDGFSNDDTPTLVPTGRPNLFQALHEERTEQVTLSRVSPNSSSRFNKDDFADSEHYKVGTTAWLCRTLMDSLTFLVQSSVLTVGSQKNKNALRRCHATLKLWMNGYQIWAGGLDKALEFSVDLKHTTISLLLSLCVTLRLGLKIHLDTSPDDDVAVQLLDGTTDACSHARLLLSDFDQPTSDIDSSDDDVSDDGHDTNGTERVAEKIKMYTNCLLDLSAALECPAPDAEHVDPVVTQPQRNSLPRAAKADAIPRLSGYLADDLAGFEFDGEKLDAQLPHVIDQQSIIPPNLYYVPELGSHTCNQPLESSSSAGAMRSVPVGVTTDATQLVSETVGDENGRRVYECPFRKAQAKLGLLYTCTEVVMDTVSAVRRHLTRNLPGRRPPHLPFLKLCPTCNEDTLNYFEFETRHGRDGFKCEDPHRYGGLGQQEQYDRLYSKIENHIATEEAMRARLASGLVYALGPSMSSQAEDRTTKGHPSSSDHDHGSMHPPMSENHPTSPSGGQSEFSKSHLEKAQRQASFIDPAYLQDSLSTPHLQTADGFKEEEPGDLDQSGLLVPNVGSSRHLSEPGTTKRQPEIDPTSSSTVQEVLSCDVEGCDKQFLVGRNEKLARRFHNRLSHRHLHLDQSQVGRSQSPEGTDDDENEHPSEIPWS